MREVRRVCVRGLIYKDSKLFGQKLQDSKGDWWCTPGGGVDPLESLHDALTREMIEETGIKPAIGRLVLVQQFAAKDSGGHDSDEQLEFFFMIENVDDYESVKLENTSHGMTEIAEFGFIDPVQKNMLPAVLQTPKARNALVSEQPVIFYSGLA